MPFFRHNNSDISYSDQGEGEPIVLIHGFALDKRQWDPQVEELVSNGHRVLTYDMRGFGESDLPVNIYSHEDDLSALLNHLSVEEKVHIVGSSFGATTAMEFATKHPEKIKALTLLAPSPGPNFPQEDSPFPRFGQLAREGKLEQLKEEMLAHESMASLQNHPDALNQASEMIESYLKKSGGWHFINNDPAVAAEEGGLTEEKMSEITCPTQILFGSEDYEFSEIAAEFVHKNIDNSNIQKIEGLGHLANLENPHAINNAILKFDEDAEGHEEDLPRVSIASILM